MMPRRTGTRKGKRPASPLAATVIHKEHPQWGRRLVTWSGWIMAAFLGVPDLPAKIVSFSSNAPAAVERTGDFLWDYKQYEGRFSSDPQAWTEKNILGGEDTADRDEGEIQLSITHAGAGRYAGEIHSKYMAENSSAPWSRVMLEGALGVGGKFEGEVWDVVNNQKATYARFSLVPEDPKRKTLRLIPSSPNDGVFPGEVVLWPTDKEMAQGIEGKLFHEVLRDLVRKQWKAGEENVRKKLGD